MPGHCPGSLCFFSRENELLIGGDVLFAGGVGRWDLPGGDGELLFAGIREKLYSLGDNVIVLPGHGPPHDDRRRAAGESIRALNGPGSAARATLRTARATVPTPSISARTSPNDLRAVGMWARNAVLSLTSPDIRRRPAPASTVASRRAETFPQRPDRLPRPSSDRNRAIPLAPNPSGARRDRKGAKRDRIPRAPDASPGSRSGRPRRRG